MDGKGATGCGGGEIPRLRHTNTRGCPQRQEQPDPEPETPRTRPPGEAGGGHWGPPPGQSGVNRRGHSSLRDLHGGQEEKHSSMEGDRAVAGASSATADLACA